MFFERIKEMREQANITQKQLAAYLGVSDRSVGYYETGQRTPPPDVLEKLADYFNTSVDYLLGRTNTRNNMPYWTSSGLADESATTFAQRFKKLRLLKGLTEEDLASALGIPSDYVISYENGSRFPDHVTLTKIVDYFDTSLDYILGRLEHRTATSAASRNDDYDDELPEQARKELESFKDYLRMKYNNKNNS